MAALVIFDNQEYDHEYLSTEFLNYHSGSGWIARTNFNVLGTQRSASVALHKAIAMTATQHNITTLHAFILCVHTHGRKKNTRLMTLRLIIKPAFKEEIRC